MEQRFATFSHLLITISRCVQRIKNMEMAALGLKGRQVQCLFALYNTQGGASLTRLAELCGEDKGMLSRTVKELAGSGLVYVASDRAQKYKNPILLTKKGEEIAGIVAEKISSMLEKGSLGISEEERENMYRTLKIVSENLTGICNAYAPM